MHAYSLEAFNFPAFNTIKRDDYAYKTANWKIIHPFSTIDMQVDVKVEGEFYRGAPHGFCKVTCNH